MKKQINVLGGPLEQCSLDPLTGFFRDGCCSLGLNDTGKHIVCAEVTREFLEFSLEQGNDLVSPRPEFQFRGLVPGDRWCLCALRWLEAAQQGVFAPIVLNATHEKILDYLSLETLILHSVSSD